jgi:chromosome segregation ATPase
MEAELKALEGSVETAHKLEDDLERTKESIKEQTTRSDAATAEIKTLEAQLAKLGAKQEEIKKIQDTITSMNAQKDIMHAEKAKANAKMVTDYSDTDAELKNIYKDFRASHSQLLKSIEEKVTTLKNLEAECVRTEQTMAKLNSDLGRLAAQEIEFNKKRRELEECSANLRHTNGAAAAGSPAEVLAALQSAHAAKQQELHASKAAAQSVDARFETDIADLKREESIIAEQYRTKRQQLEEARAKR